MAISSVVIIIWFEFYFEAILAGRLLAGIGHGLIYMPTLTHAAENVVAIMRGRVLSFINFAITSTTFLVTLLYAVNSSKNNDLVIGILGLVFSVVALLLTPLMPYESIMFLLRHGDKQKALENLIKLRGLPTSEASDASAQYEIVDMQLQLDQDTSASSYEWNIFASGNIRPLFLVIVMRLNAILTNNFIINTIMIAGTHILLYRVSVPENALILASIRFGFSILPVIMADRFLNKTLLNYSTVVSSSFMLLVGVLMVAITGREIVFYFALFFFVQAFSGFGIDSMQHVVTAEAFGIAKKAWSVTFATAIEYILQIVLIGVFANLEISDNMLSGVVVGGGVLMVLFAFVLNSMLPETSGLTMFQAKDSFVKRVRSEDDG